MKNSIKQLVKGEYESLDARTLLHQPITVLLGVDDKATDALKLINIHSVFDLASSEVFNNAREITESANGEVSDLSQHGLVPADAVNSSSKDTPISDLVHEDIYTLNGVNETNRGKIGDAIRLENIRDFSYWPPFRAARHILNIAFGGDPTVEDVDSPRELLPKAGEYATEKASYESVFFDEIHASETIRPKDLGAEGRQVDVAALGYSEGFTAPATGAILTFEQSWYPEGLSLGQLLHSLALAPAESTKIAVVDWSRKTSSSTTENISQSETLDNELIQNRALGETVEATAREIQSGRLRVRGRSKSYNKGESAGFAGATIIGSGAYSFSEGDSNNSYSSLSVSSSKGTRDISSEMTQEIDSKTQQVSASVRNRRAAIVREVSQSESEKIQTRTITNYNHSHALSIHYYEVVQIYRTITRLKKYERCIFIPMKQIDFRDGKVLHHYKDILRRSVPPEARGLFNSLQGNVAIRRRLDLKVPSLDGTTTATHTWRSDETWKIDVGSRLKSFLIIQGRERLSKIRVVFNTKEKKNSFSEFDVTSSEVDLGEGFEITQVKEITAFWVRNESVDEEGNRSYGPSSTLEIVFNFVQNVPFEVPSPLRIEFTVTGNLSAGRNDLISVEQPEDIKSLSDKLNEDPAYYSQLIWRNLSSQEVALLLSHYTFRDQRLIEYVDTQPLTVYGNYLVLKYYAEDERWKAWKDKHVKNAKVSQQTVPVATGGTFAEAVLGRFNASEKLDITRFWDWQESPIPIQAPDISPIQSGSRKEADNTTPGRLDSPVVNIINPPALPDPQGMSAVLNAISSSSMFRDMSGLAATASLAQQSIKTSGEGATAAAAQAGQNLKTVSELEKARLEMIGKLLGGATGLSGSGVSKIGALLNHGSKLDKKKVSAPKTDGQSRTSQGAQPDNSNTFQAREESYSTSDSGSTTGSHEVDAFKSAVGSDVSLAASNSTPKPNSDSLPDLSAWQDLISFRPLHSVQSAMIVAQHKLQPIEQAYSQISLDYYPVEIKKLPTINGKTVTAEEFLTYFRSNINQFAKPHAEFNPYDSTSGTLWKSNKPLDAVISINLAKVNVDTSRGEPPYGVPTGDAKLTIEKGSVVVSEFTSSHWNFSTAKTANDGWHPVSGTRQFGIKKKGENGSYTLYTKGADRITTSADLAANWLSSWFLSGGVVFSAADALWVSMQNAVATYINTNGGSAVVGSKTSKRYNWPAVKKSYFRPKRTWLEDAIP